MSLEGRRREAEPLEPELDDEDLEELEDDHYELEDGDTPAGTRRVTGLQRAHIHGLHRPHRPRLAHRPHRHRSPRGERRRRPVPRLARLLALVAMVAAAALLWFLVSLFQPFHGDGGERVRVVVPAHLSARAVGDLLARDGVVASGFFFDLRALLGGDRGKLRAGTYELRRDMSYSAALKVLTTPPPPVKVSELTITEGRTRQQLDRLLRQQGVRGSYVVATRHSRLLDPRHYGAPRGTRTLEGFLFPSTYQLRDPIRIPALVDDQLATFKREWARVDLRAARRAHLTPYEVLTIASIIQGEARTSRDLSLVASVIVNRLRAHMPLQMDDTVRYATGNYTTPITVSQLHSASPWNTYTNAGLPPTPISSPGLAAIDAAAHPAQTNYMFFVVKPCGNGSHAFASTYSQFQALEASYEQARARRGGRSPEFCR